MRALGVLVLFSACADIPIRDAYGSQKAAALPKRAVSVRSENERITALYLEGQEQLDPAIGVVEVFRGGQFAPLDELSVPFRSTNGRDGNAFLVPEYLNEITLRVRSVLKAPTLNYTNATLRNAKLAVSAELASDNRTLQVLIDDPLARLPDGRIVRSFVVNVYDAEGVLVAAEEGDALTYALTLPEPSPKLRVEVVSDYTRVETFAYAKPELVHFSFSRAARFFQSEVVVLPIIDVAIPDSARCALVGPLIDDALTALGTELHLAPRVLPPLRSATGCEHIELNVVDVLTPFQGDISNPNVVLNVLYVTNHDNLGGSSYFRLFEARGEVINAGGRLELLAMSPQDARPFGFLDWAPWGFVRDPEQKTRLSTLLRSTLPWRRYEQLATEALEIVSADALRSVVGLKLCAASKELLLSPTLSAPLTAPVPAISGSFERQSAFLAASQFDAFTVTANLEACLDACTEPAGSSWFQTRECVE